jgi:predicted SnoaL-like aldol condensation-catalyzing enzyme
MTAARKGRSTAFVLEAFDTLANRRDFIAAERFWWPDYVQHTAHIPPSRDALFNLVKASPPGRRYENALAIADGDYVMLHGRLSTTGPQAAEESMSRLPMFGDTLPTRA